MLFFCLQMLKCRKSKVGTQVQYGTRTVPAYFCLKKLIVSKFKNYFLKRLLTPGFVTRLAASAQQTTLRASPSLAQGVLGWVKCPCVERGTTHAVCDCKASS